MLRPAEGLAVGFVGCGEVAAYHAEVLAALGASISSVSARPGSERARAFAQRYGAAKVYESWRDQLDGERPDAFWVLTPWDVTENLLRPFLGSGVPCLFEKPVVLHSEMLRQALSAGLPGVSRSLVGYSRRFYDFVPALREYLSQHPPHALEIRIPEPIEHHLRRRSPGILRYLWQYSSSHVLDLLAYLVGPLRIERVVRSRIDPDGVPHSTMGLLTAGRSGLPVSLVAQWGAPENIALSFYCESTLISLSPLERLRMVQGLDVREPQPGRPFRSYEPHLLSEQTVEGTFKPGFHGQALNFLETQVLRTRPNEVGCTLEQALQVTVLCEALGEIQARSKAA